MTFGIRKATRPAAIIIFALVVIAIVAPRLIAVIFVPIVVPTATTIVVRVAARSRSNWLWRRRDRSVGSPRQHGFRLDLGWLFACARSDSRPSRRTDTRANRSTFAASCNRADECS
jgi:hypothetical protein